MAKKEVKEMTKAKKITNIVILVVQLLIIIACIAFSIVMVVSSRGNQKGELRNGTNLMPVMSNSMDGHEKDSFTTNDLVFVKKFKEDDDKATMIKEGDIVCFKQYLAPAKAIVYVTHRVIHIVTPEEKAPGGKYSGRDIVTRGDLATETSPTSVEVKTYAEIEGYYTGQIKGLGGVITFLKRPEAFFPLIVVPLVLLLIYNAYIIIKAALDAKFTKMNEEKDAQTKLAIAAALEAAGLAPQTNTQETEVDSNTNTEVDAKVEEKAEVKSQQLEINEEEIKRKAIEEYLAKQAVEEYKAKMAKEQEDKNKEDKD